MKVLFFDGTGMVIFYKRLDSGRFQIPAAPHADERHVEVDDAIAIAGSRCSTRRSCHGRR